MVPRRTSIRLTLAVALGAVILTGALVSSVAWATDVFSDVPSGSPHHSDVNALAGSGVTGGCAPGLYCPSDPVRRDQMATFLRRGLGRSAFGSAFQSADVPADTVAETTVITVPLTVGLPPTAVAGAAGFVQANGEIRVDVTNAAGCPCTFRAAIIDANTLEYLDGLFYSKVVLDATHPTGTIPLVGRGRYASSGIKNVAVVVGRDAGTGVAKASANLSLTWVPFGHDGTNEGTSATGQVVTTKRG